jgi:hypothetical protein
MPGETVHQNELFDILGSRVEISRKDLSQVFAVLGELMLHFQREGRPVQVDSLGTFSPHIDLNGALEMRFHADETLAANLNIAHLFKGNIVYREHIGRNPEDFIAKWNDEHPEDPVNAD